eukprot:EC122043.1.p1 GENE.EC122043.1~~EC122043.1.p1  ORF type:complete len:143 (+),score=15.21 EC122043.1:139-567(+)
MSSTEPILQGELGNAEESLRDLGELRYSEEHELHDMQRIFANFDEFDYEVLRQEVSKQRQTLENLSGLQRERWAKVLKFSEAKLADMEAARDVLQERIAMKQKEVDWMNRDMEVLEDQVAILNAEIVLSEEGFGSEETAPIV